MNNYRPISILTTLSKIIEKHALDTLYMYLCNYDLIPIHQSGFGKNHSCETGLSALLSQWHMHIDKNKLIGCVNIDLRKAFDLVNNKILCEKLKLYGCDDNTVSWFHSYLKNRKQVICIDDCKSTTLPLSHGVPQGLILGPLLFILFINDLPLSLTNSSLHMNADDTSLYVTGEDVNNINTYLHNDLVNVSDWFNNNLLVVNESKTNCMLICTQQKRAKLGTDQLSISLNDVMLSNVNEQSALGVIIDNSLKFDTHVNNVCKKVSKLQFLMFKIKSYLTYEAQQIFYNSYILPCFDYCITL